MSRVWISWYLYFPVTCEGSGWWRKMLLLWLPVLFTKRVPVGWQITFLVWLLDLKRFTVRSLKEDDTVQRFSLKNYYHCIILKSFECRQWCTSSHTQTTPSRWTPMLSGFPTPFFTTSGNLSTNHHRRQLVSNVFMSPNRNRSRTQPEEVWRRDERLEVNSVYPTVFPWTLTWLHEIRRRRWRGRFTCYITQQVHICTHVSLPLSNCTPVLLGF